MARSVWPFAALAALCSLLAGCGVFERPQRPAWRRQAEQACLAQKLVQPSAYVRPFSSIDGPGICGLEHPFKVTALAGGTVALNASQSIGCPQVAALDQWVTEVVQPIAMARFGQPVAQIDSMGSYSCRSIDNKRGARLSEHSFGNATDIGGFRLADGHEIKVVKAWTRGTEQEQAFLREVQAGACNIFTTVLAPGSDTYHYNHIHLDLAMHGRTSTGPRRICRPLPKPQLLPAPQLHDGLPDAPEIDDDIDVAQAGQSGTRLASAGALNVATPPPVTAYPQTRAPAFPRPSGLMPPAPIGAPMALGPVTRPTPPVAPGAPRRGTIRNDGVYDPDPISSILRSDGRRADRR
jgi:hypothetical protein